MSARAIDISNTKGRNAEVVYVVVNAPSNVQMVMPSGEKPQTRRIVKSVKDIGELLKEYETPAALAQGLIVDDPEIDMEVTGRLVTKPSRVYINSQHAVIYRVRVEEQVFDVHGKLKEAREPKFLEKNITGEQALKGGKLFPKKDIYNKFIFSRKYQLRHVNGLTYDFLYEIAKDLHDKNSLMMLGAGPKGLLPLVFQEGGTPRRAFLEGRIKDDAYCLILHLTNLELKALPQEQTT